MIFGSHFKGLLNVCLDQLPWRLQKGLSSIFKLNVLFLPQLASSGRSPRLSHTSHAIIPALSALYCSVFVKIGHFLTKFSDAKQLSCCLFPLSIELAINPFPVRTPGWAGRGGERGQARLPINHHLECFTELYAVINPSPSPATPHHRRPAKPKTHQNGRTLDCVKNDQERSAARPPRENRLMTRLIWFIDIGVLANEGAL